MLRASTSTSISINWTQKQRIAHGKSLKKLWHGSTDRTAIRIGRRQQYDGQHDADLAAIRRFRARQVPAKLPSDVEPAPALGVQRRLNCPSDPKASCRVEDLDRDRAARIASKHDLDRPRRMLDDVCDELAVNDLGSLPIRFRRAARAQEFGERPSFG